MKTHWKYKGASILLGRNVPRQMCSSSSRWRCRCQRRRGDHERFHHNAPEGHHPGVSKIGHRTVDPSDGYQRQMVTNGRWPQIWRQHMVAPIHKKVSMSNPFKYRGVHMAAVLSKVCERILAKMLGRHFEAVDAYGDTQWAFKTGRSRQDMIAVLISRWLLALTSGKKIGSYLSDISMAFDRVRVRLLLQKAARAGLCLIWLKFLSSSRAALRRGRRGWRSVRAIRSWTNTNITFCHCSSQSHRPCTITCVASLRSSQPSDIRWLQGNFLDLFQREIHMVTVIDNDTRNWAKNFHPITFPKKNCAPIR